MLSIILAILTWVVPPTPQEDLGLAIFCYTTFHRPIRVAVSYGPYGDCVTANPVGGQDALLIRSGTSWRVLVRGGGWIDVPAMLYHRIPSVYATRLYDKKQLVYREKYGTK